MHSRQLVAQAHLQSFGIRGHQLRMKALLPSGQAAPAESARARTSTRMCQLGVLKPPKVPKHVLSRTVVTRIAIPVDRQLPLDRSRHAAPVTLSERSRATWLYRNDKTHFKH